MFKKLLLIFCFVSGIFIASTKLEAATTIKLGVVRFGSPEKLSSETDSIMESIIKSLSASNAIKIIHRENLDSALSKENDLKIISGVGKKEGCQYMLIGSVNRDRDIVVNVRAVDVASAKILFSMSETIRKNSSLSAGITRLGDRIRERLTNKYPKILEVKGKNIYMDKGSSSGIRKGDLYRAYEEHGEIIDKDGNSTGRAIIDLAVIEIKSVQKDSSVAELYKDGGDVRILPRLSNSKVEAISKEEAKKLIRQKTFSMNTINNKTTELNYDTYDNGNLGMRLNPNKFTMSEKELANLQSRADKGYPIDQNKLGEFYLNRRKFPEALKYFQEAADSGNTKAQYNLGFMYDYGLGVTLNYRKAFDFYMKAAERGDADAQNALGNMYFNGKGMDWDEKKAALWFEKAVAQGHPDALYTLGEMYRFGWGVEENSDKAAELHVEAMNKGNLLAKIRIGDMFAKYIPTEKDHAKKQRNIKQSRELYQEALEQAQKEQNNEIIRMAQERLEKIAQY